MLSHHEIATLMIVASAPDQLEVDHADLRTLLDRGLVKLEIRTAGCTLAHVSHAGQHLVERLQTREQPRSNRHS